MDRTIADMLSLSPECIQCINQLGNLTADWDKLPEQLTPDEDILVDAHE